MCNHGGCSKRSSPAFRTVKFVADLRSDYYSAVWLRDRRADCPPNGISNICVWFGSLIRILNRRTTRCVVNAVTGHTNQRLSLRIRDSVLNFDWFRRKKPTSNYMLTSHQILCTVNQYLLFFCFQAYLSNYSDIISSISA